MICNIHVDSWHAKELTDEQWSQMVHHIRDWPKDREHSYEMPDKFMVDLSVLGPILLEFNLKYEVVEFSPHNAIVKMAHAIHEKLSPHEALDRGNLVHIHIPNLGIMVINKVTHLDDCCTDVLQDHLDKGWRILAVCPPNAQRRPDYILGRTVDLGSD